MSENVWDVILSKTEEMPNIVKIYKQKDEDFPEKEIYYAVHEKFKSEELTDIFEKMKTSQFSAEDLAVISFYSLKQFPSFDIGESADISQYVLLEKNIDIETAKIFFDILLPNLYCVLLLEAHRKSSLSKEPNSLTDLMNRYGLSQDINFSTLSRNISNDFPQMLQELFLVSPKAGKREYQIRTPYPELFLDSVYLS